MKKQLHRILLLVSTLTTPSFAGLVSPDCVSIKATVTVPIERGDLETSRQNALVSARRESVKSALSTKVMDLATYRQSADAIERSILQKPDAFVARCQVDSEDVLDDGQNYRMAVVAEVRQAALKSALVEAGIVEPLSLADKPKVMVLIKERFDSRVSGTRYCETQLARQLQQKGFKVVDADQKKLLEQRERAFAEASGDRGALMQSAMAFPADYLLVGEVAITSSGPLAGTDLKARFANLSLKIVETTSGTILATLTGEGRARHIDELTGGNWAMEDVLKIVGPDLLSQFKEEMKKQLALGAPITIDFYGIEQAAQRQQAQTGLQGVDRVAGVTRRFFVPGVTQFEVRFKGPASELSAEIQKLSVDGQPVEVLEAAARYLRVSRGGASLSVKAGAETVLAAFVEEKFKDFQQEKLREANKEVIARIDQVAKDTRVNDEQRKELFAVRKEIEQKEREASQRMQELAQRQKDLKAAEVDYAKMKTELALAQQASASRPAATVAASPGSYAPQASSSPFAAPVRTYTPPPPSAPPQAFRTSERTYAACQNVANARSNASTAVADELASLNDGMRAVNTVAATVTEVVSTARNVESTVKNVSSLFGGFGF
jgi:hypothetical protein